MNANRENLKKKYPGLSLTELTKKAGEEWKTTEDKAVPIFKIHAAIIKTFGIFKTYAIRIISDIIFNISTEMGG